MAVRLTPFVASVAIRVMKFFVPLFALAALVFSGCATDANRRALYSPKQGDGYWTRSLNSGAYKHRELADAHLPGEQREMVGEDWPDRSPGWRVRQMRGY
jgi:hypothetical protein